MNKGEAGNIFSEIIKNTNSDLLLFFIILAVVIIILAPTVVVLLRSRYKRETDYKIREATSEVDRIKAQTKADMEQFQKWTERENRIISVIERIGDQQVQVAQALTKLSTVLDTNNRNCEECKLGQFDLWNKVMEKINSVDSKHMSKINAVDNRIVGLESQLEAGIDGIWSVLKKDGET